MPTGPPCPNWIAHDNTNVEGGQRDDASTLSDCQKACADNADCTGFDYILTNPPRLRCWLTGPWSGARNDGNRPRVTHYDIDRNCSGKCETSLLNCYPCMVYIKSKQRVERQ